MVEVWLQGRLLFTIDDEECTVFQNFLTLVRAAGKIYNRKVEEERIIYMI